MSAKISSLKKSFLFLITIEILIISSISTSTFKTGTENSIEDVISLNDQIKTPNVTIEGAADIELYFRNAQWLKEELVGDIYASPTLTDLEGDGKMEMIILTGNSIIYILDYEGNFLPGWGEPTIVGTNEKLTNDLGVSAYPVAIDLNEDGIKEIIIATYNPGTIQAYYKNATQVPDWEIELDAKVSSSIAVGDIDADMEKELVVATWNGTIYAFKLDGSIVSGFPYNTSDIVIDSPSLGELDGKPGLEIAFSSYDDSIYVINGSGNLVTGWPKTTGYQVRASPAIVDLDNDNESEIVVGSWDTNLYIYYSNGTEYGAWPWNSGNAILNSATLGDLNLDGYVDFLVQPSNVTLYAFTNARNNKQFSWNVSQNQLIFESAIIANIDRDPYPEVIQVTRTGRILVYSHNGTLYLSKQLTDKGINTSPAIGDIDGDGYVEIIITTNGAGLTYQFSDVYCYKLGGFGLAPWPSYQGGNERIGKPADDDLDGLSNLEEEMLGTNTSLADTDGDSLLDGEEVYTYYLDPTVVDIDVDSDGDSLTNVDEIEIYNTDPNVEDTDKDGLTDGYEVLISFTDPTDSDTDDDLLPDGFEVQYENTDPFSVDTFEDLDEDDLNNFEEYSQETSPDNPDTDADGLLDGDEVKRYLTDPLVPDADLDSDQDGLTNVDEIDLYNTNPINSDSDGDGFSDGEEVRRGSDPNDPNSTPFPLWSLAPIIGGSLIVFSIPSYFIIKKQLLKRRKEI